MELIGPQTRDPTDGLRQGSSWREGPNSFMIRAVARAITTAITTWLGTLSRSHGTLAHHKGVGGNGGEVQNQAQGERKCCPHTIKT